MGLDNLLAKMEQRATATPETPCNLGWVSAKPAPVKACTLATPETPQIINAVVNAGTDAPDARHFRWLVHFSDRDPVEVRCSPDATLGEILDCRPDAIAAEPIRDISGKGISHD